MPYLFRFLSLLFSLSLVVTNLHAKDHDSHQKENRTSLSSYLLPVDHPLQEQLRPLFNDRRMFRSEKSFQDAGFDVTLGHRKLFVGAHPSIPYHLFKKFSDSISQSFQLRNYIKRIRGAAIIENYIKKHQFKHIVVPQKWLYPLPGQFSNDHYKKTYILIVEKMDIYTDWDNPEGIARKLYYDMDKEVLFELCMILHDLGGCDGYPRNQPFTRTGQIAFVDTEHVGQMKDHFHKHIIPALNPGLQKHALSLWNKLESKERKKYKKHR